MKKQYWILIEPKDEKYAWFFLKSNGRYEYKNTASPLTSWDYIPSKEKIFLLLESKHFLYPSTVYVCEPFLTSKDFDLAIVSKNHYKENDLEREV